MPHPLFRSRMISNIRLAMDRYSEVAGMEHQGLKGRLREIAFEQLLRPILPGGFSTANGKIVDSYGHESPETDVIIYNSSILPPVLYSECTVVAPIESCFYACEIKSRLTATELKDALRKAQRMKELQRNPAPENPAGYAHVAPVLFAFESDLQDKTELERLAEINPDLFVDPQLVALCVVGKGYWYHKDGSWVFRKPSTDYDEVLDFLSGITNTLLLVKPGREGKLGHYLMAERESTVHTASTE